MLTRAISLVALLHAGAIFGFFYAWVCSTMWGLDAAAPEVAVRAMRAMNASVRNATFAPAFFATPFVLALAAWLSLRDQARRAAGAFGAAALIYLLGGMVLTLMVNVPMNEALAALPEAEIDTRAAEIWQAYSPRWQRWNLIRTILSGIALLLAGLGLLSPPATRR